MCSERIRKHSRLVAPLRRKIRNLIREEFQSHTFEPMIGDKIVNTNENCKHYGSEGVVVSIEELPKETGKTVRYICTNSGANWNLGQILEKTMDQLSPLEQ